MIITWTVEPWSSGSSARILEISISGKVLLELNQPFGPDVVVLGNFCPSRGVVCCVVVAVVCNG